MSLPRLQFSEVDIADLSTAVRQHGCVIVEGVCDAEQIQRVRDGLSPWLQGEKFGRNDFEGTHSERVYALLAKSAEIAPLVEHDLVLGVADDLLPLHYLLSAALAIYVHPGETPQGVHIDDQAGGFSQPMPREPLGLSTIWAFDDFVEDNGSTEVVPGSHQWQQGRQPQPKEIVQALMPAGSVLIFAGNLMHRGGANTSQHHRLGLTIQYCAPWMRQIESMLLAVPPHIAQNYSPRIQELLGYSIVYPGFMGYVDGMHPRRLLNRDYQKQEKGSGIGGEDFGLSPASVQTDRG